MFAGEAEGAFNPWRSQSGLKNFGEAEGNLLWDPKAQAFFEANVVVNMDHLACLEVNQNVVKVAVSKAQVILVEEGEAGG